MKIRVYYEDTDCGNVVYYANYLKYMERSRTEFASITFSTTVKNSSGKLLVTGDIKLAFINREGKICRIPEEIVSIFAE